MAQESGATSYVGVDFETTEGVSPASKVLKKVPFVSMSVVANQNLNKSAVITSTRDAGEPFKGNYGVDGNIVIPVECGEAFGYWLKGLFGEPTTTGTEAPYTHVFKPSDTVPSMVIEKGFNTLEKYDLLNGCKVGQMSMSVGGDGELVATLTVAGMSSTFSGTPYDSTLS